MRPEKVFLVVLTLTSILLAQTGAEYIWDGSKWLWKEKVSLPNTSDTFDGDETDGSGEDIPQTRASETTTTNNLVHNLINSNPSTSPKTSSSSASISAESGTAVVTGFGVLCAVLCVVFVAY